MPFDKIIAAYLEFNDKSYFYQEENKKTSGASEETGPLALLFFCHF